MSALERLQALEAELARLKRELQGEEPPPPPPPAPPERVPIANLVGYRVRPGHVWRALGVLGVLPDENLSLSREEAAAVGRVAGLSAERGSLRAALEELGLRPPPWETTAARLAGLLPLLRAHAQALLEAVEARQDIPEPVRKVVADALAALS